MDRGKALSVPFKLEVKLFQCQENHCMGARKRFFYAFLCLLKLEVNFFLCVAVRLN
jgi:hypothetical protein